MHDNSHAKWQYPAEVEHGQVGPEPLVPGPFPPIKDYAIIGDCRSAALVSRRGSIEWLCWPRFDSPSIFAALLDRDRGGYWSICPQDPYTSKRSYVSETNVLQTQFTTNTGTAVLTDLMFVGAGHLSQQLLVSDHEIIRRVECTEGELRIDFRFVPRASYGLRPVRIRDAGKLGLRMEDGRGVYWLRTDTPLSIRQNNNEAFAEITLRAGSSVQFSFSYEDEGPATLPGVDDSLRNRIAASVDWWRSWAKQANYDGSYRAEVVRSALALKLMTFSPSGAVMAAPTTSLPERIGGDLNWDYRYCWLRDASFTIRVLLELGYWEEAQDFLDWLLHATRRTQPELRILYTVYGELAPRERILEHLSGYMGSKPVRIGNAARNQLQMDVYGEVIDAAAQFAFRGGRLDSETQKVLIGLGNYVVKNWTLPDQGIWEPRTARQPHTHSRLLCWTALDRLISLREQGLLARAPVDTYRQTRELIRREIEQRAWNPRLQSFVSILDSDELDASLLLLSWYGFAKPDCPRMQSTYRKILHELGTTNGLLYRYKPTSGEGTFALCAFWEAEYLALGGGSLAQAHALFRRLLTYSNDLGLYAEEIDASNGAALGNFPQAFTHIGLVGAALSIHQREQGEQQLGHRREEATAGNAHQQKDEEEVPA